MFVVDALGVRIGIDIDEPELRDELFALLTPMSCGVPEQLVISLRERELVIDGVRNATFRAEDDPLQYLLHMVNRVSIERTTRLAVHAGAVVHDGGAILLPAAQDHGKSTLTAALVLAGCGYLSDECASFEFGGDVVLPYPKALALSDASMDALGLGVSAGSERTDHHVLPSDWRPDAYAQPAPVRAVVLPRYDPGRGPAVEPISRSEAVLALVQQTFRYGEHGGRALRELGRLTRSARTLRLAVAAPHESAELLLESLD